MNSRYILWNPRHPDSPYRDCPLRPYLLPCPGPPVPSDLTSAFRIATRTRVTDTGRPLAAHREPFIQTMNCRQS